jgi:CubicO group peptidase (beta-lactamase class C family)
MLAPSAGRRPETSRSTNDSHRGMEMSLRGWVWRATILTVTILGIPMTVARHQSPDPSSSGIVSTDIEHKIRTLVAQGNLPSLQAAVVSDGRIVWSKGFGEDTSVRTAYMNGSIQKVFDATAILQLHDRGLLSIDNDVNDYLPFPVRHPGYPRTPVTLKMLLGHRSGLDAFNDQFYWDTQGAFVRDSSERKGNLDTLTMEQYLLASLDSSGGNYRAGSWCFEPGTQFLYSISAYTLVKYIIARVSGKPYPEYMRENILGPLSMANSGFTAGDPSLKYARPFTRRDGMNLPLPLWEGNVSLMRSTADDMAKFLLVHISDGAYGNIRILNPETIALMHARYSHKKGLFHLASDCPFPGYGLGMIDYGGGWYGHGGSTVGFQSLWSFNKSKRSGYVILTNVNGILNGRKNFDEVWATVSAVEKILKSELDPPSALRYVMLVFCLLASALGLYIVVRRRRARTT